ncbi:OsmC family protein [bacterium SCSIO 12741]|nr:OsmC family protein [bacterium SCSIO 12741]
MEIQLNRTSRDFEFTAQNADCQIPIVATPELSGDAPGFRPMELMLVSLAGCLSIDVLQILGKQRQTVQDYQVKVKAERIDAIPAIFKNIHVQLELVGDLDSSKVEKAIDLSRDKYCSASKILEVTADIQTSFTIKSSL